jgi:glutamine amidotransferase
VISIVDYGLGNIRAFANVYKRLNMPCEIVKSANELEHATKIILPGVGAFDEAMSMLNASGMRELLDDLVVNRKIPVFGICVGMQVLGRSSDEGEMAGLGWIDGAVKKFDTSALAADAMLLPHMGWNTVTACRSNPLLANLANDPTFYFLHSYYFTCPDDTAVLARTDYGGQFICAVNSDNVYGVQFHPEKSHHNGVQLLKNFGEL